MRVDAMALEQRAILCLAERPARGDVDRVRHGERRVDGIDAAHEIDMLRRRGEGAELLAPEREENAARRLAERFDRIFHRVDLGPDVAGDFSPWRPAQREQRDARGPRRLCGIGGDDGGVRMGRIDQRIDLLGAQIGCEPFGAAEAADAAPAPAAAAAARCGRRATASRRDRRAWRARQPVRAPPPCRQG